jgi:protoporphyrinogen oxidase
MSVADFLVLGGGLAGLAAATSLGNRAIVLERDARPGGLVRTVEIEGWWFDRVIHLLHFSDADTKERVLRLTRDVLAPCAPLAFVVTDSGTARYPIQEHLGHLDIDAAVACLEDAARERFTSHPAPPGNYREVLLRSFGQSLCDLFFFPYNLKMWRRDLDTLAPAGFVWNIARPDLARMLKGAICSLDARAYNSDGWYPRPPAGAPLRGMEVLAAAVATQVHDLRLNHEALRIRPAAGAVTVRTSAGERTFSWRRRCVATLALPVLVSLCEGVPENVAIAARSLVHNRVLSVAIRVKGPRPDLGLWRYYPSPEVVFTRLVFLHAFDPMMAPPEGWPLLAEIPWRAGEPVPPGIVAQAVRDARRVGALGPDDEVLDATLLEADPAYVVFSLDCAAAVGRVVSWLRSVGIEPVGRYGRWEYSSMAQVLRDGYALGAELLASPREAE